MGGGDLNLKKSWHPVTRANQEKKWLAEQRLLEEQKKTEQLQKELQEERRAMEMQKLQEEAGLIKKRSERLDWMYAGPSQITQELQEDYLLGRKTVSSLVESGSSVSDLANSSGALLSSREANTPFSQRDMESKLREDPLFAIKKREQEMLKRIMANPANVRKVLSHQDHEKDNDLRLASSSRSKNVRHSEQSESTWHNRTSPHHPYNHHRTSTADNKITKAPFPSSSQNPHRHRHRHYPSSSSSSNSNSSNKGYPGTNSAKVSSLSKEERAAKLAEMMQNANETEMSRTKRIDQYRREDDLESSLQNGPSTTSFLGKVQKDAFIGQDKNLSDRIRSKRFTVSRPE